MFSVFTLLVIAAALSLCPFWRRERHVLPLYLWAVYCGLGPATVLGVSPLRFRWVLGCSFGALGLWWLWRSPRRTVDSMVALPAMLIAWALASVVYSELPNYSLMRAVALIPMFLGVFLGVRSLLHEDGGIERVAHCLIALIGVQVALTIGAYLFSASASSGGRFQGVHRATGTAHQLAYALPFVLLMVSRSFGWRRAAGMGLTALMVYLLLITRSRAGILSGVAILPVAYFVSFKRLKGTRLCWAMAGTTLLGATLWTLLASDQTLEFLRITSGEELVRTRAGRWELILDELWDSPWIGHGYGTVRYFAIGGAMTWTLEAGQAAQVNTHNEFLSLWYDLGLMPMAALSLFVATIGWRGATTLRAPNSPWNALLVACTLSWFVDALETITHDGLLTIGNPVSTWFWIKSLLIYYATAKWALQHDLAARGDRAPTVLSRGWHAPA
jgi:O-antigen ligase